MGYDERYFDWQRSIGAFGGLVNQFRFRPYIRPTDRVLDFGCGGGYLLASIPCAERRGVEINPAARVEAERNGVQCFSELAGLPDAWADVVISNSALEHVDHPLATLEALYAKVRPGGRIVIGVPNETLASTWHPNDINQHFYSWSPMTLGNLVTRSGFTVETVKVFRLMRPPLAARIYRVFGDRGFRVAASLYRWLRLLLYPLKPVDIHADVMVLARKDVAT